MKSYWKLSVTLVIACSAVCSTVAGAWSVWDDAKSSANTIQGKLTGIAINDQDILVKVATKKSKDSKEEIETLKVCSSFVGGDAHNLKEMNNLTVIREAITKGQIMQITYESVFNRCISSVQEIETKNVKTSAL